MNGSQRANRPCQPRSRNVARALLVALFAISQAMIWWPSTAPDAVGSEDASSARVVTLTQGAQYGQCLVAIDAGQPVSMDVATAQLAQRLSSSTPPPIELRLSGGVSQEELARLRQSLLHAPGAHQIRVSVSLLEPDGELASEAVVAEPSEAQTQETLPQ